MKLKIKLLVPEAVIPQYAKPGDAAMDLVATSFHVEKTTIVDANEDGENEVVYEDSFRFYEYGTGLSLEIPEGYVGLIFPRSSVSTKGLSLANSVGVIDSGYRGEIKLRFYDNVWPFPYKVGDKIGQIMIIPYPQIEFEEVEELSTTSRNANGFGSTGK